MVCQKGEGKTENVIYCCGDPSLIRPLFLMNWHEIKCWTRIFLNLNFWLSPSTPLNFQFVFLVWVLSPKAMMAAQVEQLEIVQEAQNCFGRVRSHRPLC